MRLTDLIDRLIEIKGFSKASKDAEVEVTGSYGGDGDILGVIWDGEKKVTIVTDVMTG